MCSVSTVSILHVSDGMKRQSVFSCFEYVDIPTALFSYKKNNLPAHANADNFYTIATTIHSCIHHPRTVQLAVHDSAVCSYQ